MALVDKHTFIISLLAMMVVMVVVTRKMLTADDGNGSGGLADDGICSIGLWAER